MLSWSSREPSNSCCWLANRSASDAKRSSATSGDGCSTRVACSAGSSNRPCPRPRPSRAVTVCCRSCGSSGAAGPASPCRKSGSPPVTASVICGCSTSSRLAPSARSGSVSRPVAAACRSSTASPGAASSRAGSSHTGTRPVATSRSSRKRRRCQAAVYVTTPRPSAASPTGTTRGIAIAPAPRSARSRPSTCTQRTPWSAVSSSSARTRSTRAAPSSRTTSRVSDPAACSSCPSALAAVSGEYGAVLSRQPLAAKPRARPAIPPTSSP